MRTYLILLCLIIPTCFSCNSTKLERDVFLGFKLGQTITENKRITNSLISNLLLKNDEYGLYHEKWINNKHSYYLVPLMNRTDSVITKLKVFVVDIKENIQKSVDDDLNNRKSFNLGELLYGWNKTMFYLIERDVNSSLIEKYGNPNYIDSTTKELWGKVNIETKRWVNKNGVDITLEKEQTIYLKEILYRFTIIYELNDDIKNKLPKHNLF
jgi:hypothetical protein